MPLVGGQLAHHRVGMHRAAEHLAESGKQARRRSLHRLAIDQCTAAQGLAPEENVLCDRHRRDQAQLLIKHLHAPGLRGARIGKGHVFAVDGELARVCADRACDDLAKRAFAAAVRTDERMHLASLEREFGAVEGEDAAETLADVCRLQDAHAQLICSPPLLQAFTLSQNARGGSPLL